MSTGVIIALAVVFILVIFNNKRNIKKLRERKSKNFRDNYFEKKQKKDNSL